MISDTVQLGDLTIVLSKWDTTFRDGDLFIPITMRRPRGNILEFVSTTGFDYTCIDDSNDGILGMVYGYIKHFMEVREDSNPVFVPNKNTEYLTPYGIAEFVRLHNGTTKMVSTLLRAGGI